jgi:hypothetical protein
MGPGPKVTRRLSVGHLGGPTANNYYYYENQIKQLRYPVYYSHCGPTFPDRSQNKHHRTNFYTMVDMISLTY